MYNNPYIQYNPQTEIDVLNARIGEMEKAKAKLQQQQATLPAINQTFQLSPTGSGSIKYVNSIEDVKKEIIFGDTPFFSKDMSIMWIKNMKGDIKSFELKEIVEKDEKDMLIDALMLQIEDLKKEKNNNEQPNIKFTNGTTKNEKSSKGKSDTRTNK